MTMVSNPFTIAQSSTTRRVVMDGISWATYQLLLSEIGDGHTRLTFDRGRLEIMSPLPIHEHVKKILARLIEAYADAMELPLEGLGSTTFSREDLEKGVEPDECYYVQHAAEVVGKERFDMTADPAPDLAIEIDIHPPDIARQPIYAALGVPEVWRYDGREVVCLHRDHAGRYDPAAASLAFPDLPLKWVNELLVIGLKKGQSAAAVELRKRLKLRLG